MGNAWVPRFDSSSSISSSSEPSSPCPETDDDHSSSALERHLATMEAETGHSGSSELVSVTPVDEKKKEEEKKPEPIVAWPYQYYPTVAQPHFLYEPHYSRKRNCLIM